MGPFKWDDEYSGYHLVMDYGIGDRSDLVQQAVKVNEFKFEPKEGGMVDIKFRLQIHPQPEEGGKLMSILLKGKTEITLTPPEEQEPQQQELETEQTPEKIAA
jgi:hypothetical protein